MMRYLVLIAVCWIFSINTHAAEQSHAQIPALLLEQEQQGFSGSVLLAHKDQVIYEAAFGLADRSRDIENRTDTHYSIASLGKLFTMVAVLTLVEEGLLSLDDELSQFLSGFTDSRAGDITILELLSHRAGWQNYWQHPEFLNNPQNFDRIADYLEIIKPMTLAFEPGSQESYSNIGFIILGAVIEEVSGQDYREFLKQRVFEPLEMANTDFPEYRNLPPNYALIGGGDPQAISSIAVRGTADGGGYSTTRDIFRIYQALAYGELLNGEHLDYLSAAFRSPRRTGPFALRLAGGAPGVNSVALYEADSELTVIILTNNNPPVAMELGETLMQILRDQE